MILVQDAAPIERKQRKSVAFADGASIVDENGGVTETNGPHDRSTAESHSTPTDGAADKDVDDVAEMLKGLGKKKKKPKEPKEEDEDIATAGGDAEFDPSALKLKKKKKVKKAEVGDFEAKLAEAGVADEDKAEGEPAPAAKHKGEDGDMEAGTGIWQHSSNAQIGYPSLLDRFFAIIQSRNPDMLSSGSKSYKIPPPQCLREGNKKTIFANIADICKRMRRTDEHVTQFLFAELGTSGSVDGSKRLVLKGRFQQKQIENVLRRYIGMPVKCAESK